MDSNDNSVTTVNPQVFRLVSATYLLENRRSFEVSHVTFYRVKAQIPGRWEVEPASFSQLEFLASDRRSSLDFALPKQWTADSGLVDAETAGLASEENAFNVRWTELLSLSPRERIEELAKTRQDFEARFRAAPDLVGRANVVAAAIETAFLVNRASMGLNKVGLTSEDQELVKETTAIVQSVVSLVMESHLAVTLFQTFQSLSNGLTVNHIVRVFSTMVAFLVYYNDLHSRGLTSKVRAVFGEYYREHYRKLLPNIQESLVTSDNLVRLPHLSETQVRTYALGALMHDIGKVMDLGYFETATAYDPVRIKQHPILGSGLFQRTYGNKYEEARYIIGDHHNYLFHPDGYGLTRWERLRGNRKAESPKCCVADLLAVFTSGQALGFLPVEICGLVDVYDALTDPGRLYKQAHEPVEAVAFMVKNFREAQKFDPVLFDIFLDFLREMGVPLPPEAGFQGKYDRKKG